MTRTLPVLERELRAQARQPFTFTLRVLGVGVMLAAAGLFALQSALLPNLGAEMFRYLHLALFLAIWILVPLSAADCISRERREGTLGLLFLTPLKPTDIVLAKSIAHGLRAMTLLLAILPVLTIPFLMGGVSWQQASMSALTNFSAVCWALAAAVAASAGTRSGLRASVGAILLAVCGFVAFAYFTGLFASGAITMPTRNTMGMPTRNTTILMPPRNYMSGTDYNLLLGFALVGISPDRGIPLRGMGRMIGMGVPGQLLTGILESAGFSLVVLLGAIVFAAWRIRRNWRGEPPPLWVQQVQAAFCTPVLWLKFYKRWMRWKIERNPIGWLEQRTWTGRLVTWAWFAIVISIYSAALSDRNFFRNSNTTQLTMAWLMMGSIAASAAGSFRRERESGLLELLLVTPLSTGQIIGGRLRGLWGQFVPAVGLLLGIWLYFDSFFHTQDAVGPCVFFASTFFTLPMIGLCFSVRCKNFISAFLATLLVGLGLPFAYWPVAGVVAVLFEFIDAPPALLGGGPNAGMGFVAGVIATQMVLALLCLARLRRRLEQRDFPVERTAL